MLFKTKEFVNGFFNQIHVIHALVLRETRTRFGKHSLGYLWAFAEPLMWIGTMLVLFQLGGRRVPSGMEVVTFLSTGLLPYIMFRKTLTQAMNAIKGNKSLLYFPQVRPLDLVAARAALEGSTFIVIFVVIVFGNSLLTAPPRLDDPLQVLMGFVYVTLLGAGVGLTLSSLTGLYQTLEHFVNPLLRPLLWLSGCFFAAKELPYNVREILLWNPVLHIVEYIRDGFFCSYNVTYYSIDYVVEWIVGSLFLGLVLEQITRRRLEA